MLATRSVVRGLVSGLWPAMRRVNRGLSRSRTPPSSNMQTRLSRSRRAAPGTRECDFGRVELVMSSDQQSTISVSVTHAHSSAPVTDVTRPRSSACFGAVLLPGGQHQTRRPHSKAMRIPYLQVVPGWIVPYLRQ